MADFPCDSAATRTRNLLLRRQLLYPVELRNLLCRDDSTRTSDLLVPNQAFYQLNYIPFCGCKDTIFSFNFTILTLFLTKNEPCLAINVFNNLNFTETVIAESGGALRRIGLVYFNIHLSVRREQRAA